MLVTDRQTYLNENNPLGGGINMQKITFARKIMHYVLRYVKVEFISRKIHA